MTDLADLLIIKNNKFITTETTLTSTKFAETNVGLFGENLKIYHIFPSRSCFVLFAETKNTSELLSWNYFPKDQLPENTSTPRRFFKQNPCITSHFKLESFLDSIEHDFLRIWKSETGKARRMNRHQTYKPVLVQCKFKSLADSSRFYFLHLMQFQDEIDKITIW